MSSLLSLQAVIFDCDGVLVDTEPLHYQALQEVLAPLGLGHSYARYLEVYIGFDDRDAFLEAFREAGRPVDPATLARLIAAKAAALQRIVSGGISSFPGVVALVRDLARGRVPLAVASGALRHEVQMFITALGISDAFPVVVAADDVSRSKPDPETYRLALERVERRLGNRLDPGCVIAIEDTPTGIQSAKAAGLFAVGVAHSFPADQLTAADHVFASLEKVDTRTLTRLLSDEESSLS